MKLVISQIFILFFTLSFSQTLSSEYKIAYAHYNQKDYEISKDTINAFLYFNENYSLYEMNGKTYDLNAFKFNENDEIESELVPFTDYVWKSFQDDLMFSKSQIAYQNGVILKQDLKDFEIIARHPQDVKNILGYECSAVSILYKGRRYKIYYTEKFNSAVGPWKFHGLKGLILEVIDLENQLHIIAKKIEKNNKTFENPFKNNMYLSWNTLIDKASILYSKDIVEQKRCCNQRIMISGLENDIERYELNSDYAVEVDYKVYIELTEKNEIDKSLDSDFKLILTPVESNYFYVEKIINNQGLSSYGYVFQRGIIYKDIIDRKLMQDEELMGRKYLIEDEILGFNWKISDEKDVFLGYNVRKAITEYKGQKIIAWFTPDIPISNGPDFFGGLPGLILRMEVKRLNRNSSEITFYDATSIDIASSSQIKIPNKGKSVTLDQFQQAQEDAYQRRRQLQGYGVDTSE